MRIALAITICSAQIKICFSFIFFASWMWQWIFQLLFVPNEFPFIFEGQICMHDLLYNEPQSSRRHPGTYSRLQTQETYKSIFGLHTVTGTQCKLDITSLYLSPLKQFTRSTKLRSAVRVEKEFDTEIIHNCDPRSSNYVPMNTFVIVEDNIDWNQEIRQVHLIMFTYW